MAKRTVNIFDIPMAFVDLETTGLREDYHEIIEIGLLVVRQSDLMVLDEWETKVKPLFPDRISAGAQLVNGFNEEDWTDAPDLPFAFDEFIRRVHGALLASWNIRFESKFLEQAFRQNGMELNDVMDYHGLDIMPLAMEVLRQRGPLNSFSLNSLAPIFGIEAEPKIHRAINGARLAFEVYKKAREIISQKTS